MVDLNINTILYGPPGTGKTYTLSGYMEDFFTDRGLTKNADQALRDRLKSYPLWKILAVVIYQNGSPITVSDLLSNALVNSKINPENKHARSSIWRILQSYADDESTDLNIKYRGSIELFHKSDKLWSIIEEKRNELKDIIDQGLFDLAENPNSLDTKETGHKTRYNFITFHQKYSYEDFIEGIKPLLKDKESEEIAGELQFELKKGIFYNSCLEALQLIGYASFEECFSDNHDNRREKFARAKSHPGQQFGLFIDEINRANISAVFGELITLLEEDKRLGADNEMWVELPYSNEKFCVPGNLYVIGTMNTADRSIALLDIALRRRFEFKALYPLYDSTQWWSGLLEGLNQEIYNWKKNPDFFIGHAFFINREENERTRILNTKIIPLLYEYCQNNSDTVKRILSGANVKIKQSGIRDNFQIIAE